MRPNILPGISSNRMCAEVKYVTFIETAEKIAANRERVAALRRDRYINKCRQFLDDMIQNGRESADEYVGAEHNLLYMHQIELYNESFNSEGWHFEASHTSKYRMYISFGHRQPKPSKREWWYNVGLIASVVVSFLALVIVMLGVVVSKG